MRRGSGVIAGVVLAALGTTTCRNPADANDPVDQPDNEVASFDVAFPSSLIINQHVLLAVTGVRNRAGQLVSVIPRIEFLSTDSTVVKVSSEGVVTGLRRGSATIRVVLGGIEKSDPTEVKARVRLLPNAVLGWGSDVVAAAGDSIQFAAIAVDIDGQRVDEESNATWTSSDPAAVSISSSGLAVAHLEGTGATITARTADGSASTHVAVAAAAAGSATVRFAHAAFGMGPLTFYTNKTRPVTVSFGESVESLVSNGVLLAQIDGFPDSRSMEVGEFIESGSYLTVYVGGFKGSLWLKSVWSSPGLSIPSTGQFRLMHGGNPSSLLWMVSQGSPVEGTPDLCYFDAAYLTDYFSRSGPLDFVLEEKAARSEFARLAYRPQPDRSVTIVIAGESASDIRLLEFVDP